MIEFDGNVRDISGLDDSELRASLKGGWNQCLPAIKDENGVVVVGHRRLKIAEEEGIKTFIQVVEFGSGPDADAERVRLANVSNIGASPMTKKDRTRQEERLYRNGLTMAAISHMTGVSEKTVSLDLKGILTQGKNSQRPKTASNPNGAGRPQGKTANGETVKSKTAKPTVGTVGFKITVPDGYSLLSEAATAGMKIEGDGGKGNGKRTEAIEKSGLSLKTYRIVRDIVLLTKRDDLSPKDTAIVKKALKDLDATRRITEPWERVQPIAERVWGKKGNRSKTDKKRLEHFDNTISSILSFCESAAGIVIPYITTQANGAIKKLDKAKAALGNLQKRIQEESSK